MTAILFYGSAVLVAVILGESICRSNGVRTPLQDVINWCRGFHFACGKQTQSFIFLYKRYAGAFGPVIYCIQIGRYRLTWWQSRR